MAAQLFFSLQDCAVSNFVTSSQLYNAPTSFFTGGERAQRAIPTFRIRYTPFGICHRAADLADDLSFLRRSQARILNPNSYPGTLDRGDVNVMDPYNYFRQSPDDRWDRLQQEHPVNQLQYASHGFPYWGDVDDFNNPVQNAFHQHEEFMLGSSSLMNFNRYEFFVRQLKRSGFLENRIERGFAGPRYFAVRLVFGRFDHIQEFGPHYYKGYIRRFGANAETFLRGTLQEDIFPWDIHNPLIGLAGANNENLPFDVNIFQTPFYSDRRGANAMSTIDYVDVRLVPAMRNIMKFGGTQGSGAILREDGTVDDTMFFVNAFLVELLVDQKIQTRSSANLRPILPSSISRPIVPNVVGGPSDDEIDLVESLPKTTNRKFLFTPPLTKRQDCFWQCLLMFLVIRSNTDRITFSLQWYFNEFVMGGIDIFNKKNNGKNLLKRYIMLKTPTLVQRVASILKVNKETLCPLPVERMKAMLELFDCFYPVLMFDEHEALISGSMDNIHLNSAETNHFMVQRVGNHLSLILSYTAFVPVKKCHRCKWRFNNTGNLNRHLQSNACMTCLCDEVFQDELQWRYHKSNLRLECKAYKELHEVMDINNDNPIQGIEKEILDGLVLHEKTHRRNKMKRFLHDKMSEGSDYDKSKERLKMAIQDHSELRNCKSAIYFDLETIVPLKLECQFDSTSEDEYQKPFACSWLTRENFRNHEEPHVEYGPGCIEAFINYLDQEYNRIYNEEKLLWLQWIRDEVNMNPLPRTISGARNTSARIIRSWNQYTLQQDKTSIVCMFCDEISHEAVLNGVISDCAIKQFAYRRAKENLKDNSNGLAPRVTIWAHNGGKFDWVFIHRYLIDHGLLNEVETVRNGSKYFELSYRSIFKFRDSLLFMQGSLDKLSKDFGVQTKKGVFPYRLVDSISKIETVLIGEDVIRSHIPHEYLHVIESVPGVMKLTRKRPMTEEEYVDFFFERGWVYNIKEECIAYLKDDVKCLSQIMESFASGWESMPNSPNLFKYCTIGQMCHSYFLESYLKPEMYPCLSVVEDSFIRRALYGGRTEVFTRLAPEGLPIHYVDVNSLYPHVMESCFLPCGDPTWHINKKDDLFFIQLNSGSLKVEAVYEDDVYFERLKDCFNNHSADSVYGFLEVDVLCTISEWFPVLPERRGGKNMFTNMSKKRHVYYSEELKLAIRHGCCIEKIYTFSEWQRGSIYKDLIHVLKEQKMLGEGKDINGIPIPGQAKNPSLRAAAKTAQNSLFGKTIQKIDSMVELVYSAEQVWHRLQDPDNEVVIEPLFRTKTMDIVEMRTKFARGKIQKRSCAAIGTAILAEARMILYSYFEAVKRIGGQMLYCDTDSIVFSSMYSLEAEYLHDTEYGKMKVEIDPSAIMNGGFVAASPKCYSFLLKDGSPYVRCKGVSLSENTRVEGLEKEDETDEDIEFSALCDVMEEERKRLKLEGLKGMEDMEQNDFEGIGWGLSFKNIKGLVTGDLFCLSSSQTQFERTRDRNVLSIERVKTLTPRFDKRIIVSDPTKLTIPMNDYNVNIHEIIMNRKNTPLSDFLDKSLKEDIERVHMMYCNNDFFMSVYNAWLESDSISAVVFKCERGLDIDVESLCDGGMWHMVGTQ